VIYKKIIIMNIQKDIDDFSFTKKGDITITGELKRPVFNIYNPSEKLEGIVYMWVEEIDDTPTRILYIGKAGKTLFKRCGEHLGGFKGGSKTGIRNATELLKILSAGTKVGIYSRHSETKTILGQENISLCSAEEKALINRYKGIFQLFNKI
jgi:hypothetical protein